MELTFTPLPPDPFYFIRHGETDWNREQKVMGHTDIPLNPSGLEQIHHTLSALKNLGIERLVTSPLQRASQTAAIIGASLHLSPEPDPGISEICWGEWQGKTVVTGYNFDKWVGGYTPQGAESCVVFCKRITEAILHILSTPKKTLLVSHNGVYWALMRSLGYPNCNALNCVPYLFDPQNDPAHPWTVLSLEKNEDSETSIFVGGQEWFQIRP